MTDDLAGMRLAFALIAAVGVAALFLFDAYAWHVHGVEATASALIHEWSRNYPIIPFIVGALMAHLFWKGIK